MISEVPGHNGGCHSSVTVPSPGVDVTFSGGPGTGDGGGGGGQSAGRSRVPRSKTSIVSRRTASHFAMTSGLPSSVSGHGACQVGRAAVSTVDSGPTATRMSPVPVLVTFTAGVTPSRHTASTVTPYVSSTANGPAAGTFGRSASVVGAGSAVVVGAVVAMVVAEASVVTAAVTGVVSTTVFAAAVAGEEVSTGVGSVGTSTAPTPSSLGTVTAATIPSKTPTIASWPTRLRSRFMLPPARPRP